MSKLTGEEKVIYNKGCREMNYNILKEIENKVWEWTVQSGDLAELKTRHIVSGTIRRSAGVQVRVVSETQPDDQAENVSAYLEDAYLYFIGGKS